MISLEDLKELNDSLTKLLEDKVFTNPKEEDLKNPSQYFSFLRKLIEVKKNLYWIKETVTDEFQKEICTNCGSQDHKTNFDGCKSGYYCDKCYQFGHLEHWTEGMCGDYECKRCNNRHAGEPCDDLR